MSEPTENVQVAEQVIEQPAPTMEQLKAFAFGNAVTVFDQPADPEAPAPPPAEPAPPAEEPGDTFDENVYLKNAFGYESAAEIKSAIEEYNKLKAAPAKAEFQFPDDESKRIADAISNKNYKELRKYAEAQDALSGLDGLGIEEQVKLKLKLENPLFDSEMIEDEFKELYTVNEDRCKDIDGEIDQLKLRKEKIKVQQNLERAAAMAKDFFSQYKTKIELPAIKAESATQDVIKWHEEYQASMADNKKLYDNVIVPALSSLKEADVNMNLKIQDEANQMNFDLNVQVDQKDFELARKTALHLGDYLDQDFYDDKGNLKAAKLTRLVLLDQHFEKYLQSAARQAVNAERKRVIEKETPSSSSQRNYALEQNNEELKRLHEFAFGK